MQCPVCKETQLVMTERQNIEIDYCPQCRGVWLDRGELDKIIERSQREEASYVQAAPVNPTQPVSPQQPYGGHGENYFGHSGGHHDDHHGSRSKGHGGFLKRLFD
ncbi:TFIIB-type zinc ribbon-containing protein [Noviherbaspirillum agri]